MSTKLPEISRYFSNIHVVMCEGGIIIIIIIIIRQCYWKCQWFRLLQQMYLHVVHLCVCLSAKVVGWNEMPFGRDTAVVPSNIALEGRLVPPMGMGDFGVGPQSNYRLRNGYCRNSPCTTVPSPTPYDFLFPQITWSHGCHLSPSDLLLLLLLKCSALSDIFLKLLCWHFTPSVWYML